MAGGLSFLGRSADDTTLSPAMQAWLQQQVQEVPAAVAPGFTGYVASTAPAAADPDKVLTPLGQKWAGDLKDVVTAPQRAYTGELQVWDPATGHTTDAAREAAMGLAGMAMTGGFGGVGPGGVSVGSGPIRAYHGSPHDFDAFSMAKIGSGEGNQAFGKGMYFAGNENVARTYRDALSAPAVGTPEYEAVRALRAAGDDRDAAAAQLASQTWSRPGRQPQIAPKTQAAIDMLRSDAPVGGRMYEVQINADPAKMLDYDKPLSQQPHVVEALKPYLGNLQPSMLGGDALNHARATMKGTELQPETVLRDAGVPGIRYLDNGSRGTGQGTHNYVAFSDDIVSILRKYGLAGMAALGAGAGVLAQPGDAQAASR